VITDGGVRVVVVVGVGCTAQWSGTVAAAEDGTPLRPAVIWIGFPRKLGDQEAGQRGL